MDFFGKVWFFVVNHGQTPPPPRFSYFPGKLNEKVVVTKDLATHEKNS